MVIVEQKGLNLGRKWEGMVEEGFHGGINNRHFEKVKETQYSKNWPPQHTY